MCSEKSWLLQRKNTWKFGNISKYNHEQKSIKFPFVVCSDTEYFFKKTQTTTTKILEELN